MKLMIESDLVYEGSLLMPPEEVADVLNSFGLHGEIAVLSDNNLRIRLYSQKCTLDEPVMSALFNEVLYRFCYHMEFKESADFDPDFYINIGAKNG